MTNYTVSQKTATFLYIRITVKRGPISIIFRVWCPEETLQQKVVNLSTTLPCVMQNSLTVCNGNIKNIKKLLIQAVKV